MLHVVPPLLFTLTILGQAHNLAVPAPPSGYCSAINICGIRASKISRFCTITFYFNWPNILSVGIVDVAFQSAGTGKYATPTRHLKFHFVPLAVSYDLFPRWNQRPLDFFIKPNNTLQLSWRIPHGFRKQLPSGHYAAFSRVAGHAALNGAVTPPDTSKIAGSAMQNDC